MGNSNNNVVDANRINDYVLDCDIPRVKEVFKYNYYVESYARFYRTILYNVQNADMIRTLLEYQPIREHCLEYEYELLNYTPLMNAITLSNCDRVRAFLDCGADVNHSVNKYDDVQSPLSTVLHTIHADILFSDHRNSSYEILELLLQNGADPNLPTYTGNRSSHFTSHLEHALYFCSSRSIKILLKHSAKVVAFSSIFVVIRTKHDKVEKLKLLLAYGGKICVDADLFVQILNNCEYEMMEIIFAYTSKFLFYKYDVPLHIVEKDWKIERLLAVVCPQSFPYKDHTLFDILTVHLRLEDIRNEISALTSSS